MSGRGESHENSHNKRHSFMNHPVVVVTQAFLFALLLSVSRNSTIENVS